MKEAIRLIVVALVVALICVALYFGGLLIIGR